MSLLRSTAVRVTAATALVASGLTGIIAAQAQTPRAASTASAVSSRHVVLRSSTNSFPRSVKHSGGGAINLTEDGSLQRFVDRSKSARPNVTVTGHSSSIAGATWLPVVAPTAVSSTRPGLQRSWKGLDEHDNSVFAGFSLEPPDQGLCAGHGHVLELINDVVRIYTSNGAPEHDPVYLNDFFGEPGYQFTTDPSCVYDAGNQRFVATELTLAVDPATGNLTGQNWLDLAVSKTGNPNDGFNIYRIDVTDDGSNGTPSHTACPCIGDYPQLGTDANGVYLTTNEYPFSSDPGVFGNNFNGAQLYALPKAALAAGQANVTVLQFENLRVASLSGPRYAGFTLKPALSAGKNYARGMNFLSSFAAEEARPDDFTGHSNTVGLWTLSNTRSLDTTPAVTLRETSVTVPDYGIPPLANQKPGPVPLRDCLNVGCVAITDQYAPEQEGGLDSSDTRVLTAAYVNGHVYGALDTAMQVSGNVRSGFEWVDVSLGSPSAAAGYVGVTDANVTYPALATDPTGRGYIGVTLSGNNYYPSAAYLAWDAGHPASAVSIAAKGQSPQDGFCEYVYFQCGAGGGIRPRWGDYGYAAWDGTSFYVANEYIASNCTFATFNADHTCGGTRTFYGNFATRITKLS